MSNCRKIYEEANGNIPEGFEIHHITPRFAGGDDSLDNLIALSKKDHAEAHLDRYEAHRDFRDLCAYYVIGYNFSEAHKISSPEGGKIGGNVVKEKRIGILVEDKELRRKWASMGGKAGGKVQKELRIGIHGASKEQLKEWSSKGGKASGSFKDSKIQSKNGKKGGIKNKGFKWYNDGIKDYKYTQKMQGVESFEDFLNNNKQYSKGRKKNGN